MPNLINSYSLSSVIGIGTDTPNQNLTVVGGISSSDVVYDKSNNSKQWTTAYTFLTGNSATFAPYTYVNNNFLPLSGGILTGFTAFLSSAQVYGNLTVNGNLTATGNTTFANTRFTTTSALSVINTGAGPALYVQQANGPSDIASFYNSGGVEVLHVGSINPITNFGKVGVNVSYPNNELTVGGSISATGNFNTNGQVNAYTANFTNPGVVPTNFQALNIAGAGTLSVFQQLQNTYAGVSASADLSIYNDNGNYLDLGINSSLYNGNLYPGAFNVVQPNDAYLYNAGSANLALGTAGSGDLLLFTGGVLSGTHAGDGNESMRIKSSGNVGIGTTTPNQLLTVQGNISSSNVIYDSVGNSVNWNTAYSIGTAYQSNSGAFLTAIPQSLSGNWQSTYTTVSSNSANWSTAYSLVSGGISSGPYSFTSATSSTTTLIGSNTANNTFSEVLGGVCNLASGTYSTIVNGFSSCATGYATFVGAGSGIRATGNYAVAVGGQCNTASGCYSIVGGGSCNRTLGNYSTVVGGFSGCATGYATFVGAGSGVCATGNYAVAVGGNKNTASGNSSVVVGGNCNIASGLAAVVLGGSNPNTASGNYSVILGGYGNNCAISTGSIVLGGQANVASGQNSIVLNGVFNTSSGTTSTASGYRNTASGNRSSILGGVCNTSSGCYTNIVGGLGNYNPLRDSIIGGGVANHTGGYAPFNITAAASISGNGSQTCLIGTGIQNCFSYPFTSGNVSLYYSTPTIPLSAGLFTTATIAATGTNYVIVNGDYSTCTGTGLSATSIYVYDRAINNTGYDNFIGGGKLNTASGCYGVLGGGKFNTASGAYSTVGGGTNNKATGACSVVSGGISNCASAPWGAVLGGSGNVAAGAGYAVVGGGSNNNTCGCGGFSAVLGGTGNSAGGQFAFIGGGSSNNACAQYTAIAGGLNNISCGIASGILGGKCNTASNIYSTIAGGRFNYNPLFNSDIHGGSFNHTGGYRPWSVTSTGLSGNGSCTCINASNGGFCGQFSLAGTANAVSIIWTTATTGPSLSAANYGVVNVGPSSGSANAIIVSGCDFSSCTSSGLSATNVWLYDRCLNNSNCNTFIGGGILNTASGNYSSVVGGVLNHAQGVCTFVGGGLCNCAGGGSSVVVGGAQNCACGGTYNSIVGGNGNLITCGGATYSFIGGGYCNNICSSGTSNGMGVIGGGRSNCLTTGSGYSGVLGGCGNIVSNIYSSVVGGRYNTASGAYSFVAGGSANNTKGFANTFILGTSLSAIQANYTYVNNLSSQGTVVSNPLAVANSQTAMVGVGAISGKFQIFDANGNSLGYVPIYSTIT